MERLSLSTRALGGDVGDSDDEGYVLTRRYRSKKQFPLLSHDCTPPCTPRRKLANALALDSEFNVLEKRMAGWRLDDDTKEEKKRSDTMEEEKKSRVRDDYDSSAKKSLRDKRGDLIHRAGVKVGDVYCLVSCYLQKPDVLRFSVHVSEKCLLYEVLCAHPTIENEVICKRQAYRKADDAQPCMG